MTLVKNKDDSDSPLSYDTIHWLQPWLQSKSCPRIAWYPSAGHDVRDLLYLNQRYVEAEFANFENPEAAPSAPDIYLHTDYSHAFLDAILEAGVLFEDEHTEIEILKSEELPKCPLDRAPELITDPERNPASDRVFFLELEVRSGRRPERQLGTWKVPMLYAFVENTAFCCERMLALHAQISHIVRIRYGGGFGGGRANGTWILNTLSKLQCEVFICEIPTDGEADIHCSIAGDDYARRRYPILDLEDPSFANAEVIHEVEGVNWDLWPDCCVKWHRIPRH